MANAKSSKAAPAADDGVKVGTGQQLESELPEDGVHRCVIAEVVDQGWEHKFGAWVHSGFVMIQLDQRYGGDGDLADVPMEVRIWFDIEKEATRGGGEERRINGVGTIMVVSVGLGSLQKGTRLKKRLEEMMGRRFTASDYEKIDRSGINLSKLIGNEYRVQTSVMTSKAGKEYAEIIKMMPKDPKSKEPAMEVENYTPFNDREERAKSKGSNGGASAKSRGNSTASNSDFGDQNDGGDDDEPLPF